MVDNWEDYDVPEGNVPVGDEVPVKKAASGQSNYQASRNAAILKEATERALRQSSSTRPTRPRAPPFGATTLLGPKGFRRLREAAAKLNFSGNTGQDLDRVMTLYRDWVHQVYPKFIFTDVVDKTEKVCRTAPMKAYLVALKRAQAEGESIDEIQFAAQENAREAMEVLDNTGMHDSVQDTTAMVE